MSKRKSGRRSKYHTHVEPRLIEIEGWARDGVIDEEIAKKLGVAVSTFHNYKKQFPELMESLKRGKEIVDREVENALLKRALGYEYIEKKYETVPMSEEEYYAKQQAEVHHFKLKNPEATAEEIRVVELGVDRYKSVLTEMKTKEVIPDTTAQIFWLKNRKPVEWRDRQEIEHSGGLNNTVTELTLEERQKRIAELKAKLK